MIMEGYIKIITNLTGHISLGGGNSGGGSSANSDHITTELSGNLNVSETKIETVDVLIEEAIK